jgi:hypothetical protein
MSAIKNVTVIFNKDCTLLRSLPNCPATGTKSCKFHKDTIIHNCTLLGGSEGYFEIEFPDHQVCDEVPIEAVELKFNFNNKKEYKLGEIVKLKGEDYRRIIFDSGKYALMNCNTYKVRSHWDKSIDALIDSFKNLIE